MNSFKVYIREGINVSLIMATGDVVAQTLLEKTPLRELDVVRTAKFGGIGFFIMAPTLRYWYGLLDRIIAKNQSTPRRALKKMALDQCLFAPALTLGITATVGAVNGETPQRIKDRIQSDYLTIMSRNYILWPAAQMINFSLVPIQYQVVFAQFVAIIWNCYLSMMLNKSK